MNRSPLPTLRALPALGALVAAAFALALTGCDAGKEPFEQAAAAIAKGDLDGASQRYDDVCAKKSPLCETARRRKARLAIVRGWRQLSEAKYGDARATFGAAVTSDDGLTATEAAAALAIPELVQGVAFEAALAATDKDDALAKMEAVAGEASAVAPRATEWLQKNRPAILRDRLKKVCSAASAESCVELARKLLTKHPESPEAKEALTLVAESYARQHPVLKDLEPLLVQRVMVFDRQKKIEACQSVPGTPDYGCVGRNSDTPIPEESYLETFWAGKLAALEDPALKERFRERWEKAGRGEYDPETWPKP